MGRYIYEIVAGSVMQQYTIVYENKTYWYCKVHGCDKLREFRKAETGATYRIAGQNTRGFYSDDREELTTVWDMERLVAKRKNLEDAEKCIARLERELAAAMTFLNAARADWEAAESEHARLLGENKND